MTDSHRGTDEGIAEQRLRLASLESCEERIRSLREEECDLEVEHIAAQAALHSMTNRLAPNIDAALAVRIGRSLDHRHRLPSCSGSQLRNPNRKEVVAGDLESL